MSKAQSRSITQLHQFIEQFNFATIICHGHSEFNVSHIPVILDRTIGSQGTLKWHLAKKNPQVQILESAHDILCIFHGPHAYISPRWYKTSPNVPTWNYATVSAYGKPTKVESELLENDLTQLVSMHESESGYVIPNVFTMAINTH